MAREIKFRFWDIASTTEGRMVSWGEVQNAQVSIAFIDCVEVTPMQFTGLKDKNGVDIYEGDIVEVDIEKPRARNYLGNNNEYCTFKVLVEWDCGFCYRNLSKGKSWKAWHIKRAYTLDVSNIKIIGNIYETSELIKQ